MKKIQYAITISALVLAAIHVIRPDIAIDYITLTLVFIAIIPWLVPLFKSLEFPGGWKVEFQKLEKVTEKVERAGLLANEEKVTKETSFPFEAVARDDPNLALIGLRIEIEKRIRNLAESHGIPPNKKGLRQLLQVLIEREVLRWDEINVLQDLLELLSPAAHGAGVNWMAVQWAIEIGPRIIIALDERFVKTK